MKYKEPEWEKLNENKQKLRTFNKQEWTHFYDEWMCKERPRLDDSIIYPFYALHPDIYNIIRDKSFENVLDIGCANGTTLFSLYFGNHIKYGLGIDVSSLMIDYAKEYADKKNITELKFENSLFENYTFNNTFDLILCTDILEHFISVTVALDKIYHLLCHNGLFCGRTPENNTCDATPHLHYFTQESLSDLLGNYFLIYNVQRCETTNKDKMLSFYGVRV